MRDFAQTEFWLDSVVQGSKSGMTQRAHLTQLEKVRRVREPKLEVSRKGIVVYAYLWEWFRDDLKWQSPLSYRELGAWAKLSCKLISAEETKALMMLDKLFRNSQHAK